MIFDDSRILAELADGVICRPNPRQAPASRYSARLVGRGDRLLDVELDQEGRTARTWIALPGSLRPQPWLTGWEQHHDPAAWLRQLVEWLDEEMYTGGLGPSYRRVLDDGQPRLVVDGYGFRLADDTEHRRLRGAVGPHGWHVRLRKRQIRKQYAAEWALDEVERQVRVEPVADLLATDAPAWSIRAPGRGSVFVEASTERVTEHRVELLLSARVGSDRKPHGQRRIRRPL